MLGQRAGTMEAGMKLPFDQLEWRTEYAIGNLEIDNDHRQIFLAVNQYILAVKFCCDKRLTGKMLEVAEKYALTHFEREELIMIQVDYHHYEIHKQCHRDFLQAIKDFRCSHFSNEDISAEVAYFIASWLKIHVLEVDSKLGEHIARQQQKLMMCA